MEAVSISSKDLRSRTKRMERIAAARLVKPNNRKRQRTSDNGGNDVPVVADENTSILSLNDDCFLEVFSHLTTEDLLIVKNCCQRFSYLADSTAERRFRKNANVQFPQKSDEKSMRVAAKTLLTFGRFFNDLYIHFHGQEFIKFCDSNGDGWTFASLMQKCTSLKSLIWWESSIPVGKLEAILENIETLEVGLFIDHKEIETVLKATKKLKHLTLIERFGSNGFLLDLCGLDLQTITLLVGRRYFPDTRVIQRFLCKLDPMKNLETIELGCFDTQQHPSGNLRNETNIEAMKELGMALNKFERLETFELHSDVDFSTDIQTFATRFDVVYDYDSRSQIITATRN